MHIPNNVLAELERYFGINATIILNLDEKQNSVASEIGNGYIRFLSLIENLNEADKTEALRIYDSLFDFLNSLIEGDKLRFKNKDIDRLLYAVSKLNHSGLTKLISEAALLGLDRIK